MTSDTDGQTDNKATPLVSDNIDQKATTGNQQYIIIHRSVDVLRK